MNKEYFVILYTQRGEFVCMVVEDEDIAAFETEEEARNCATNNYTDRFQHTCQ